MNNTNSNKKDLSPEQREELFRALKACFEENMSRHKDLEWAKVQLKLEANNDKLWSLNEMERTTRLRVGIQVQVQVQKVFSN